MGSQRQCDLFSDNAPEDQDTVDPTDVFKPDGRKPPLSRKRFPKRPCKLYEVYCVCCKRKHPLPIAPLEIDEGRCRTSMRQAFLENGLSGSQDYSRHPTTERRVGG
jgi:hypothetical protein